MTLTIMYREQVRTIPGALLLVSCLQLFCSSQLYGLQANMDAASAAKVAAGVEALTHIPTDFPGPKAAGAFITFDAPGAVQGTVPSKISQTGTITGYYYDANSVGHGFVRAKNGTIATFDAPGAVAGMIGTFPSDINPPGDITGYYYDANFVGHAFVRAKNGTLTTFDAPGAGTTGAFPGTYAVCITPDGTIVGMYTDVNSASHGFLRTRNGTFTTFDPPGSIAIFVGVSFGQNLYINPDGLITGTYFEPISGNPFGGNYRVFLQALDGTFTTFDAAPYPPSSIWSFPSCFTPAGAITGSFNDGFSINHGFLRASDGTITTFDVPGAGTGFNEGTAPLGITPAGEIMGLYTAAHRVTHGCLFLVKGCR